MSKAITPATLPALPSGATGWARSTRRAGGIFHAHKLGQALCGALYIDRHQSEMPKGQGDLKYFGVCPRCYSKASQ
jgi:hypothetical protein